MNNLDNKVIISKFKLKIYMSVIKSLELQNKNSKPLVSLNKISLSFKKNHLILDNISLNISKGQIIGLLGPNGAINPH